MKKPNTRSIEERATIGDKKIQLAHWEGDTVEYKDKKEYLTTILGIVVLSQVPTMLGIIGMLIVFCAFLVMFAANRKQAQT